MWLHGSDQSFFDQQYFELNNNALTNRAYRLIDKLQHSGCQSIWRTRREDQEWSLTFSTFEQRLIPNGFDDYLNDVDRLQCIAENSDDMNSGVIDPLLPFLW